MDDTTRIDEVIKQLEELKKESDEKNITVETVLSRIDGIINSCSKNKKEKRKRIKTFLEKNEMCHALCSGGTQCSRRKKEDGEFCGTHIKGRVNGTVNSISKNVNDMEEICNIKPTEDNGIIQLLCGGVLYDPEKIVKGIHA